MAAGKTGWQAYVLGLTVTPRARCKSARAWKPMPVHPSIMQWGLEPLIVDSMCHWNHGYSPQMATSSPPVPHSMSGTSTSRSEAATCDDLCVLLDALRVDMVSVGGMGWGDSDYTYGVSSTEHAIGFRISVTLCEYPKRARV